MRSEEEKEKEKEVLFLSAISRTRSQSHIAAFSKHPRLIEVASRNLHCLFPMLMHLSLFVFHANLSILSSLPISGHVDIISSWGPYFFPDQCLIWPCMFVCICTFPPAGPCTWLQCVPSRNTSWWWSTMERLWLTPSFRSPETLHSSSLTL